MLQKPERLQLFPDTTAVHDDTLHIAGQALTDLAERHGTPLYLYDRQTMDARARNYQEALKAHYPAPSSVTYAGKAFLCRGIAEWVGQQGFRLDCTGEGEMAIAAAAKLPLPRIVVHGVNKSSADLRAALLAGIIVVDNLSELGRIADLLRPLTQGGVPVPMIWLRFQPGMAVATHHAHTQTGQPESKFGMTSSEVLHAAQHAREAGLSIGGIHFHLGSNFRDPAPLVRALELAVRLAKEMHLPGSWDLCAGGGWGTATHEDELPQPEIDTYVGAIAREVVKRCRLNGLPLPTLHVEPGRSLVARAGVAIYRVGAVKRRKHQTWLLVDGGMADNPRPALYGARYSCLPVKGLGREMAERVSIAGPYCESGDVLIEDLPLPRIAEGEMLAVPASGAYQLSMSGNYNGARRPAALWLEHGRSRLLVSRETDEDLTRRQLSIL